MGKQEKKQYAKIDKEKVYDVMISIDMDFMAPDHVINLVNIASLLNTSRYQVKRYIEELKADGLVKLETTTAYNSEDEPFIPYTGYTLTDAGRSTEEYLKRKKAHAELLNECFGIGEIALDD